MSAADIRAAVLAAIGSIAPEQDLRSIRAERPLRDEIGLDSLDWLNVSDALQQRLGAGIPEDRGRPWTLDALVEHLAARHARAAAGAGPAAQAGSRELPRAQYLVKGTWVTLRPMQPGDIELEAAFVRHLSGESRYKRFMVTMNELPARELHELTEVDQQHHVALAAVAERDGRAVLLGVARYVVDGAGTGCEFAVTVDDAWHGCGLAGLLMRALIDLARSRGLQAMEGIVLRTNSPMLKLARQLGFEARHDPEDRDTVRVSRPLQGPQAPRSREDRAR